MKIPNEWKKAQVSAIYKKGDRKLASNYRPISLTSILCKCMEGIVRDHIMDYMSRNNLFSNKQYGFLRGRSTTTQLLQVLDEWTEAIEHGYSVDCVHMDFSKHSIQFHIRDFCTS